MSDKIEARLDIEIFVNCPNCHFMIDLLNEDDTNGDCHDDDDRLLKQVFSNAGLYDDFECGKVTCGECKHQFDVKGLEW